MVKKSTFKTCFFTSLFWIVVIVFLMVSGNKKPLYFEYSGAEDFALSEFGSWIVLPEDATDIKASFYGDMDTNYRVVALNTESQAGISVLHESLQANPQYTGDEVHVLNNRDFSLDGFFSVFRYSDNAIPEWWVTYFLGLECQASLLFWERNGYGYGYVMVTNEMGLFAKILQFSSQHLELDMLKSAFPETSNSSAEHPQD